MTTESKRERRRRRRRGVKEGEEAEEEGNRTSEMFPITEWRTTGAVHGLTAETEGKKCSSCAVCASFLLQLLVK